MLLPIIGVAAALAASAPEAARAWRQAHERAIIDEFVALLSIPNVARNAGDMRRNATHLRAMMEKRGIATRLLEAPGAPPAVYGEMPAPGATRTIVFYAHYDGQPVEPAQWSNGDPFRPEIRDGRIWARSAGDDKAPVIAWMAALDALKAAGIQPRANLKFFLDGEEEAGSPHLAAIVEANKQLLAGDVWIFCDGPVHQTRRQQVVFGARGSMGFQLIVYGPRRELHSGHYGNWAPNPAAMLARLVASMRDDDGRVLIQGFYDEVEPLSDSEKRALARAPIVDQALQDELWIARTEGSAKRLDELINLPALNVRGLAAAGVGEQSRNVIPTQATASMEVRLVKGMDHRVILRRIIEHIKAQGYFVTEREPNEGERRRHPRIARVVSRDGYNGVRASMDTPIARRVIQAVESARGEVILLPTLGGSLPIAPLAEILKAPTIVVPIANHDNNQHGHNENIRLENLWDGIETMAALMAME